MEHKSFGNLTEIPIPTLASCRQILLSMLPILALFLLLMVSDKRIIQACVFPTNGLQLAQKARLEVTRRMVRVLAKHPEREKEQRGGGQGWQTESYTRHQLSGVSWVSMSTLQIGHFLLVTSHWSTQAWWKRCMQGNLLLKKRWENRVSLWWQINNHTEIHTNTEYVLGK